ncbi:MAG: L,D-transpeptidase, partial [Bradyrhizobium sp.]
GREAEDAARSADETKTAATAAERDAKSLKASLRKLEQAKARTEADLKMIDRKLAAAKTEEAKAQLAEARQKLATQASDAATQLDAAKADAAAKLAAVASTKEAAKVAAARKADATKAATDAQLATEPVSVYISRSTQMVYVRRNTHKPARDGGGEVFDTSIEAPVEIRDPERPIGTHIFTAVAQGNAGLRWTAVTIDDGDDAKDALDRITIPKQVLDRIAPTAVPRSSIIVSDEPLSSETNYRTEFVAVLSNQPQGGFVTRKPTTNVDVVASGDEYDDGFGNVFQRSWDGQPITQPRRRGPPPTYFRPVQPGWW